MGFKTVKFTQELSIHGLSCWPSLEWDMEPGEDPQEVFTKIIAEIKKLDARLSVDVPPVKTDAAPEIDMEFEAFKQKLSMFKYREEAEAALVGSGYSSFNIEIKKILESLSIQGQA